MAQDIRNYNINIVDVNGDFIAKFENVKPKEIIPDLKISDGKFVDASTLIFEVVAENVLNDNGGA